MPDWKDPKAYEKNFDRAGWTWEFMRRNAIYREDFAQFAKALKAAPRKGHLFLDGKAAEADQLGRELGAKWGQIALIANPTYDAVPPFFLVGPFEPDGEQVNSFYYEPNESELFNQKLEFATLTFDLRRPLRPQLKRARCLLQERKKGVTSIKPTRSSEKEWGLYLRVLDAKEAGAKTSEIIGTIEAYKDLDNSIDSKYAASDRVSDHHKRAQALRDDPLSLIL